MHIHKEMGTQTGERADKQADPLTGIYIYDVRLYLNVTINTIIHMLKQAPKNNALVVHVKGKLRLPKTY